MRPPRIAILVLFFSATIFLLCRSIIYLASLRRAGRFTAAGEDVKQAAVAEPVTHPAPTSSTQPRYGSFLSYSSPFSLFPPNAIITLTDDNGTSFPARPAAFGPPFPNKGLSGQLWIGSGFADDNFQGGEGEGELGCSDHPGWDDNIQNFRTNTGAKMLSDKSKPSDATEETRHQKRQRDALDPRSPEARRPAPDKVKDDGTDDHLAAGVKVSEKSKSEASSTELAHADIQSLQEAAEIEGKVVLLSRGGCGFADKVMWAQRRGSIAVIVGDNQRGGPLIQMYARGDTSNITIPSVFTSRTTAHILSSLMQPGSFLADAVDENGNSAVKVQQSDNVAKNEKANDKEKSNKAESEPKKEAPLKKPSAGGASSSEKSSNAKASKPNNKKSSWLKRFFDWVGSSSAESDVRAPEIDRLDWVVVEDWDDAKDDMIKEKMNGAKPAGHGSSRSTNSREATNGDNFQIGVQDWRDPDLVNPMMPESEMAPSKETGNGGSKNAGFHVGTNTPESGEYGGIGSAGSEGFVSRLFDDDGSPDSTGDSFDGHHQRLDKPGSTPASTMQPHEGLWVTITPSSSTSPFLDTLFVLVISPLITLTVVYALLVLRARIRRRRWRAPKSVVDRLPVRTYHTVTSSPASTLMVPSPSSSSPRTPLLQQHAHEGPSRSRPRSQTSMGIPNRNDQLRPDSGIPPHSRPSSRTREREKSTASDSQWRKYMGKQVECVVCLEEYVDGVSRVMSLPCGHEFHAECITPWLTTRRRTCPICKGDVVRSLARGTSSGPSYEP